MRRVCPTPWDFATEDLDKEVKDTSHQAGSHAIGFREHIPDLSSRSRAQKPTTADSEGDHQEGGVAGNEAPPANTAAVHQCCARSLGSESGSRNDSQTLVSTSQSDAAFHAPLISVSGCVTFVQQLPQGDSVLSWVNEQVSDFLRSYVAVPGFHNHMSKKVREWILSCKSLLQAAWSAQAGKGPFPVRKAGLALESCIMAGIHAKVFCSLCAWLRGKDAILTEVAQSLATPGGSLSPQSLRVCGVPERLWAANLSAAAGELRALEDCCCPLEMMQQLLRANDCILASISQSGTEASQVSADELFPLFIASVVLAAPSRLAAVLEYLLVFHSEGDLHGRCGYQIAMLEASAEFLLQCHRRGMPPPRAVREAAGSPAPGPAPAAAAAPAVGGCSAMASQLLSGLMGDKCLASRASAGSHSGSREADEGAPNVEELLHGAVETLSHTPRRGEGTDGAAEPTGPLTSWQKAFETPLPAQGPARAGRPASASSSPHGGGAGSTSVAAPPRVPSGLRPAPVRSLSFGEERATQAAQRGRRPPSAGSGSPSPLSDEPGSLPGASPQLLRPPLVIPPALPNDDPSGGLGAFISDLRRRHKSSATSASSSGALRQ